MCTNWGLGPLQASARGYLREIGAKNTPVAPKLGSSGGDVRMGTSQKTQGYWGVSLCKGGRCLVPRSLAGKAVQYLHDLLHVGSSGKAGL